MHRRAWWSERSWEERAWAGLLLANLAAALYLVVRTPSDDATWLFRIVFALDAVAFLWWVGRAFGVAVARLRTRQDAAAADGSDAVGGE
jgi:hypothetical protein